MIGTLIVGVVIGFILAAIGIIYRWWMGLPTVVTASGWALGPLRWGGWGILLGALLAAGEVLYGKRLRDTWGLAIVISSFGSMLGGLAAWWLWTTVTAPAVKPIIAEPVKP